MTVQWSDVQRLFLDTAPVIYFVERNTTYVGTMRSIFQSVAQHHIELITSPVTLSECLVYPLRKGDMKTVKLFRRAILHARNTTFYLTDDAVAETAATLRAQYKFLELADSFQFATALAAHCDAFLTNDIALKRVQEIKVITIDELLPPS